MEAVKTSVAPPKGKPKWLRVKLPVGQKYKELRSTVEKYDLHTICTSGSCPNMGVVLKLVVQILWTGQSLKKLPVPSN